MILKMIIVSDVKALKVKNIIIKMIYFLIK